MTITNIFNHDIPTFIRSTSSTVPRSGVSLWEKARQGRVLAHSGVQSKKISMKNDALAPQGMAQLYTFPPAGELIQLFESRRFDQACA
ncbi:MAG: hypothetical protein V3V25_11675 [Paracoccaceae bacterium]